MVFLHFFILHFFKGGSEGIQGSFTPCILLSIAEQGFEPISSQSTPSSHSVCCQSIPSFLQPPSPPAACLLPLEQQGSGMHHQQQAANPTTICGGSSKVAVYDKNLGSAIITPSQNWTESQPLYVALIFMGVCVTPPR